MRYILFSLLLLPCCFAFSQQITSIETGSKSNLRGLSVVSDDVIWASGSGGTVLRSIDGGAHWDNIIVPGYEKTDFRDIQAFSKNTAVIMGIDTPAVMLRTSDGGKTWARAYYNNSPGMFLDAMTFWNKRNGMVIGDPLDGRFFIIRTKDQGKSWQELPYAHRPLADSGEALFAASGTNVRRIKRGKVVFITGGLSSNVVLPGAKYSLPLLKGISSAGANSIAVKNISTFMVVGGDYTKKADTAGSCVITHNGGRSFAAPQKTVSGYRSCVEYISDDTWLACGLNGVDITKDDGVTFTKISDHSFNTVIKSKRGSKVYLAGAKGAIGVMEGLNSLK